MELEGVRGMAALMVVAAHFVLAFYPTLVNGDEQSAHTPYDELIHGTPLALLYAGMFAVAIFFVLSGFVLSIGFFQTKDVNIVKKLAASRYLRLMLPALASILIAFFFMSVGFARLPEAAGLITGSASWLSSWSFDATFFDAIRSGALDIFIQPGSSFNNVLWTMYTEFLGSFLVFAILLLFAQSKYRWIMYIGCIILTFNTWFMPFIIGMIVADMYTQRLLDKLRRAWVIPLLLIGGLFLGSMPSGGVSGTMYEIFSGEGIGEFLGVKDFSAEMFYLTVGATMVVLAVLLSKRLSGWFGVRRVALLGRYTFSLYLTHLIVLYVIAVPIFLQLYGQISYNRSVAVAVFVAVPFLWAMTWLFERYIDAPSIRFAKYVGATYRGDIEVRWSSRTGFVVRKVKNFFRRKKELLDLDDQPTDHAP